MNRWSLRSSLNTGDDARETDSGEVWQMQAGPQGCTMRVRVIGERRPNMPKMLVTKQRRRSRDDRNLSFVFQLAGRTEGTIVSRPSGVRGSITVRAEADKARSPAANHTLAPRTSHSHLAPYTPPLHAQARETYTWAH